MRNRNRKRTGEVLAQKKNRRASDRNVHRRLNFQKTIQGELYGSQNEATVGYPCFPAQTKKYVRKGVLRISLTIPLLIGYFLPTLITAAKETS